MMEQFHAIKEEHPDTVLFFRMGDFYEMFFDDAVAAAAADGEAVVSLLLRYGAEANVREASAGQTPLMFASAYDRAPSLKALLSGGADIALTTRVVDVLERVAPISL